VVELASVAGLRLGRCGEGGMIMGGIMSGLLAMSTLQLLPLLRCSTTTTTTATIVLLL
jgi:hypothetical protein